MRKTERLDNIAEARLRRLMFWGQSRGCGSRVCAVIFDGMSPALGAVHAGWLGKMLNNLDCLAEKVIGGCMIGRTQGGRIEHDGAARVAWTRDDLVGLPQNRALRSTQDCPLNDGSLASEAPKR